MVKQIVLNVTKWRVKMSRFDEELYETTRLVSFSKDILFLIRVLVSRVMSPARDLSL